MKAEGKTQAKLSYFILPPSAFQELPPIFHPLIPLLYTFPETDQSALLMLENWVSDLRGLWPLGSEVNLFLDKF